MKKAKLTLVCLAMLLGLCGCGERNTLTDELGLIELSGSLPETTGISCRYLYEADHAVYVQQKAAALMYYEAYTLTDSQSYKDEYGDDLSDDRIASICNDRRKELYLEVDTMLHDNVEDMVKSVEDCDNLAAYIDRIQSDCFDFYHFYAEYFITEGDEHSELICTIMKTFYERNNLFAFAFMQENRDEFVNAAVARIIANTNAPEDFNMYIAENNVLIRSLNTVYGGVKSEYAQLITTAQTRLIRNMLEHDNELDEASINMLMYQLGEPTPSPVPTETPAPTATPRPTTQPTPQVMYVPVPVTPQPNVDYNFGF